MHSTVTSTSSGVSGFEQEIKPLNSALTAAVVTSSIGRPTLRKTVESVRDQGANVRHYVFAHGRQHWEAVKNTCQTFDGVEVIYLPNNNGGGGYGMAPVFAAAPYLVSEDVVFYLDDDNWYEPGHIHGVLDLIDSNGLDWAFSLRNIVADSGELICQDRCESLGYFRNVFDTHLVDNSSYAVRTGLARRLASSWYHPVTSDRQFLKSLFDSKASAGCTGRYTVNYRLSQDGSHSMSAQAFMAGNEKVLQTYGGELPWEQPTVRRFT
jgi:hypothetical protein